MYPDQNDFMERGDYIKKNEMHVEKFKSRQNAMVIKLIML